MCPAGDNYLRKVESFFTRRTPLFTLWDGVDAALHIVAGSQGRAVWVPVAGVDPQGLLKAAEDV